MNPSSDFGKELEAANARRKLEARMRANQTRKNNAAGGTITPSQMRAAKQHEQSVRSMAYQESRKVKPLSSFTEVNNGTAESVPDAGERNGQE